jgi:hypothetical protein
MKGKEEESEQKKIKFLLNPISLVIQNISRARTSKIKMKKMIPILSGPIKNTYN